MELTQILTFNIAILIALASPGPALLGVIHLSLREGRASGLRFAIGLALGAVVWCLFAMAGLTALFALVPWAFAALKVLGAAYLIYLALRIWRAASLPLATPAQAGLVRHSMLLGMMVNLANPKSALFFASVFLTIYSEPLTVNEQVFALANVLVIESTWYCVVAVAMTVSAVRARYLGMRAVIDRACSALLAGLGLRLLLSAR